MSNFCKHCKLFMFESIYHLTFSVITVAPWKTVKFSSDVNGPSGLSYVEACKRRQSASSFVWPVGKNRMLKHCVNNRRQKIRNQYLDV